MDACEKRSVISRRRTLSQVHTELPRSIRWSPEHSPGRSGFCFRTRSLTRTGCVVGRTDDAYFPLVNVQNHPRHNRYH